jgi:hypothetical protein
MSAVSVMRCQVEVSATSWSFVQRSPTACGASLCEIKKPREWGGPGPLGGCRNKNKELISELLINDRCCGRIWCILIRQPHIIVVLTDNLGYVNMTHDSEEIFSLSGNPLKLIQVTSFYSSRVIEVPGSIHVIQRETHLSQ